MSGPPALRLRGLTRRYGDVTALDGIDLEVADGAFCALLGPSGSGKTTTLRLIAGFDRPDAGTVEIFGVRAETLPPHARPVNTVFQDYALFPHLSVRDNIAYPLMLRRVPRGVRAARAEELLALVRLPGFGDRRPAELSGGQRQRVALARALAAEPRVLLLDEPLGALDLKLRDQMQDELAALHRQLGLTFLLVTHDQGEALSLATQIAVFDRGRIAQIGTPHDLYHRPRTRFVADFIGAATVLDPGVSRALGGPDAWACLRPEMVQIGAGPHRAQVTAHRFLGAATRVTLDFQGTALAALTPAPPPVGTQVAFACAAPHPLDPA